MANDTDTHIPWNTLEGTPIDWHWILHILRGGENGIEVRKTTALEFLWRVIIHTE